MEKLKWIGQILEELEDKLAASLRVGGGGGWGENVELKRQWLLLLLLLPLHSGLRCVI